MNERDRTTIESQIRLWAGVEPPNPQAREMAAGLDATLRGFAALRGAAAFEDEPSSFEAALLATKDRE